MTPEHDPVVPILAALSSLTQPPPALAELEGQLRTRPMDLPIRDLGLDSLGSLEFCIAMEINHGICLTPEALSGIFSADQLLRIISRSLPS